MKAAILIMGAMLIQSSAWARGFQTNWNCPVGSSEKTPVEVYYDDAGKLVFEPEIFREIKPDESMDYSSCIADFQKKISYGVKLFQEKRCSSVKDSLCAATIQYTDAKVLEKIRQSYFMKKAKNVRIMPIGTSETVAANTTIVPTPTDSTKTVQAATPEAYLEEKILAKEINPRELNRTFTHQNKTYKVSDFDQVIGKHIESVYAGMTPDEGKQFAQNYMVAKSDYLKEGAESSRRTAVLENLNRMFSKMYGDRGAEELSKMLECAPEDNLTPIDDILKKLQETRKVSKCKALEPGEHKVFEKDSNNYYSTGDYLLKRKSDGNYQAFINVEFQLGAGSVSPATMMARAKKCLHEASPFIKGPNGQRIEMMAFTPSEIESLPADERPDKKIIKIEQPDFSTNAARYAEDVDCPTITHEMLHLLGLCDEYLETRAEYGDMWNCRVVPKTSSIMRNHVEAYNKAVAKEMSCSCDKLPCTALQKSSDEVTKKLFISRSIYDITNFAFRNKYCSPQRGLPSQPKMREPGKPYLLTSNTENEIVMEIRSITGYPSAPFYFVHRSELKCKCPPGDSSCLQEKTQIAASLAIVTNGASCPVNSVKLDTKANTAAALKFTSQPELPSLLLPNQFNKILGGNCAGYADGYLECAEFAYKGKAAGPNFCGIPEKCKDDKYFLGTKQ